MFEPQHLIWRWADRWDELSDWLSAAEDLVNRWTEQPPEAVEFRNEFELRVACFLLADGLLPASASQALAFVVLKTMSEAREKSYRLDHLKITPDRRGRKWDMTRFHRQFELFQLLKAGVPKMEAYQQIAEKYNKSADTIRREHERHKKRTTERGKS